MQFYRFIVLKWIDYDRLMLLFNPVIIINLRDTYLNIFKIEFINNNQLPT